MHRYLRYVYDLSDVVEGLYLAADEVISQEAIEAWILDELRLAYKVQEAMPEDIIRTATAAHAYQGWGKLRQVTVRRLLDLFDPMSHVYYEADHAELSFRNAVLTVALYSYSEVPLRMPRPPRYHRRRPLP